MSLHDFAQSTSDTVCVKYDSYASFLFLYFLNTYNNTRTCWSKSFIVNLYWVVYTGYNRVFYIFSLSFSVSTYKGFFFFLSFPLLPSVFFSPYKKYVWAPGKLKVYN